MRSFFTIKPSNKLFHIAAFTDIWIFGHLPHRRHLRVKAEQNQSIPFMNHFHFPKPGEFRSILGWRRTGRAEEQRARTGSTEQTSFSPVQLWKLKVSLTWKMEKFGTSEFHLKLKMRWPAITAWDSIIGKEGKNDTACVSTVIEKKKKFISVLNQLQHF